jgi:hypothetical protein
VIGPGNGPQMLSNAQNSLTAWVSVTRHGIPCLSISLQNKGSGLKTCKNSVAVSGHNWEQSKLITNNVEIMVSMTVTVVWSESVIITV